MYRIAVCDDSEQDRRDIYNIAAEAFDRLNITAELVLFDGAGALLDALSRESAQYDLFLLDVLMDEKNGIELAELLRQRGNRSHIIFVSVSKDYAIDGYKVSADDYLLKPLTVESLIASVKRLFQEKKVAVFKNLNGSVRLVPAEEIRWMEIYGHTIHVHTLNGSFAIRDTLDNLAKVLPGPPFVRCHRSYIINLEHVQEINKTRAVLTDGRQLPVSHRYSMIVQQAVVAHTEESIIFF